MTGHRVVSRQEWLDARLALLAKEKALTHQYDALVRERQQLPGNASKRTTSSRRPTAGKRWPTSSATRASCWSITSCSRRKRSRGAHPVP